MPRCLSFPKAVLLWLWNQISHMKGCHISHCMFCFHRPENWWKENTRKCRDWWTRTRAWPSGQQCLRCGRTDNKSTFLCHDLLDFGTPLVEVPGVLRRPLRCIYIVMLVICKGCFDWKEITPLPRGHKWIHFIVDIDDIALPLVCDLFGCFL